LAESRKAYLVHLRPRRSGKIATGFQFVWLVTAYANWPVSGPLLLSAIVASLISAFDYLYFVLHRRFDLQSQHSTKA
jgi:hypothetical protein